MAFWGVTDGQRGHMAIIETPDDAAIRIERHDGRSAMRPMGCPARAVRLSRGGCAMSFLTRAAMWPWPSVIATYAQQDRPVQNAGAKARENPNVDLLVGAVNVWCWDADAVRHGQGNESGRH